MFNNSPIFKSQQLKWNYETNTGSLITQYEDGSILSEPVSSEEAALWHAANQ